MLESETGVTLQRRQSTEPQQERLGTKEQRETKPEEPPWGYTRGSTQRETSRLKPEHTWDMAAPLVEWREGWKGQAEWLTAEKVLG